MISSESPIVSLYIDDLIITIYYEIYYYYYYIANTTI